MNTELIGLAVITYNRLDLFKKCIESLNANNWGGAQIKCVIDDCSNEPEYKEFLEELIKSQIVVIKNKNNKGVAHSKNKALNYLLSAGCEHLFLMENDILMKMDDVCLQYIEYGKKHNLQHLNFALHGELNKGQEFYINQDNNELLCYPNIVGAFSYYTKEVIETVGYIDENFKNAWDHVEHTYRICKTNYHPPFWYFVDHPLNHLLLEEQLESINNSTIRGSIDWEKNVKEGQKYWTKKHGEFLPPEPPLWASLLKKKISCISVVRDYNLYSQLFTNNEFVNNYNLVSFNNLEENLGIPTRYNSFLNSHNYYQESWFVFCHEDFYFKENIYNLLNTLDKSNIYGAIGAFVYNHFKSKSLKVPLRSVKGQIVQRNKEGENGRFIGVKLQKPSIVDTVDCCCLIVHSSLIQKYNLRFDENLTFDLYSEAFSIEAKEKYQINTYAIQINCEHWSEGNIGERYYRGINYLNNKYPNSLYAGTCSLIGGKTTELLLQILNSYPPLFERIKFVFKQEGLSGIVNRIKNRFLMYRNKI